MADLDRGPDWPTQAADALEQAVTLVRDKTVVPAQNATKAVVYGILAGFFGFAAFALLIIGLFRGLVILTGEVWLAYLICGGILVLVGAFCWTRRFTAPADEPARASR
jgi:preprotein translocase subunit SecD